jgi:hypothetical protein
LKTAAASSSNDSFIGALSGSSPIKITEPTGLREAYEEYPEKVRKYYEEQQKQLEQYRDEYIKRMKEMQENMGGPQAPPLQQLAGLFQQGGNQLLLQQQQMQMQQRRQQGQGR